MKRFAYLIISLLLFSGISSSIHAVEVLTNNENPTNPNMTYTHTVFVGIATGQFCEPCDQWGQYVHNAYNSGSYNFYYVEMISHDYTGQKLNVDANDWRKNYSINAFPTTIFDGDYERIQGNQPSELVGALNSCGNRVVADISADINVTWLGNATIQVNIIIQNSGQTQYTGLVRAFITEIVSRYKTYYGNDYHYGFLDYAFNEEITVNAGGTYSDSVIWNGNEHHDNHGVYFGDIAWDNIQVTMAVYNDNDGYVDECVMDQIDYVANNPPNSPFDPQPIDDAMNIEINQKLSWNCNDPDGDILSYDVYFGDSNPPEQVAWKQSQKAYTPGAMEYNKTYYWKIKAWDSQGASTSGPLWSFTTVKKKNRIFVSGKNVNRAPTVFIHRPLRALYLFDTEIMHRPNRIPKIIGNINIVANATDHDDNIEKVEFYINGELKNIDYTKPYEYLWKWDRFRFFHLFLIEVKVYDTEGEFSTDSALVRKFL